MVHDESLKELKAILRQVLSKIDDGTDVYWAGYNSAGEVRAMIEANVRGLEEGDLQVLEWMKVQFLPTVGFQEISLSNGWADEYLALADRFDGAYGRFKMGGP